MFRLISANEPSNGATHCNTLQHTSAMCEQVALQHTAAHCNILQHTATHCSNTWRRWWNWTRVNSTLLFWNWCHTATHCNTLQHTATDCNTMQHNATRCFFFAVQTHELSHPIYHSATHCNTATLSEPTNAAMLSNEWQISSIFLGALICISRRFHLYFWLGKDWPNLPVLIGELGSFTCKETWDFKSGTKRSTKPSSVLRV